MDKVFLEISKLEKTEFGSKQVSGFESRYQIPLALAILLFLLELMVSERRGRVLAAIRRLIPATAAMFFVCLSSEATAQTVRGHVRDGNKLYDKGKYSEAEVEYRKAAEKDPTSPVAQFNLGDAHFKQDRYEEALRSFAKSALTAESRNEKGAGYYNMGNAFARSNKFDEAIEAYKQALRNNPDDEDARYNLSVVRNKKQQQEQQKQQDKKDQQQQKRDQQQQQKDQQGNENKDQQQKPQDQQQNQQQQQQQAQQDRTKEAQRKNQMPKDEAERILEALRNNEKQLQKKLQKREGVKVRVERDW